MASDQKITSRADDYAQWYQDVIAAAERAEPAGVVKGCMVVRPHGWAIWEAIQPFKSSPLRFLIPKTIEVSFVKDGCACRLVKSGAGNSADDTGNQKVRHLR